MKLASISVNKKLERSVYKVLQSKKALLCRQDMKRRHSQLIFIIQKMVMITLRLCGTLKKYTKVFCFVD